MVDQSDRVSAEAAALAARHADTISHHQVSFRSLPRARNYGWQRARYEILIYVDDDIRCDPDFVSQHVETLQRPGVSVVAGGVDEVNKPADLASAVGQFSRWTAIPTRGFGARGECFVEHAPGGNFSLTREVIRSVGGFDEAFAQGAALGEELEFCLRVRRAGFRIYFNGAARLRHLAIPIGGCRVPDLRRHVAGLAHNRALLIRRYSGLLPGCIALCRLAITGLSFAIRNCHPTLLWDAARGCGDGLRVAAQSPLCTCFSRSAERSDGHFARPNP